MPATRIVLCRDFSPAIMTTFDFATPRSLAKNSTQSLLAAPSTGGEVSRTLSSSPWSPQSSLRDALGWIWTLKVTPAVDSVMCSVAASPLFLVEGEHLVMPVEESLKARFKLQFLPADLLDIVFQLRQMLFRID